MFHVDMATMIAKPALWSADPVKQARRLAKWRSMPRHRRVRAMELMAVLIEKKRR
jgi:hypothetical protein